MNATRSRLANRGPAFLSFLFFPLFFFLLPESARAHSPGESFLALDPASGTGTWEIAVRDLDDALELDRDGDGGLTWGELRAGQAAVADYLSSGLTLATPSGACSIQPGALRPTRHRGIAYAALAIAFTCPSPATSLTLRYRLFFDRDRLHQTLVRVGDTSAVLRAGAETTTFPLVSQAPWRALVRLIREGMLHIWQGLDHLLFLVALLLPAVLRRGPDGIWQPVASLRPALIDTARIVTAFTAAHSFTLSLAALGLLRVSGRIIEPAIAVSVVLAAANNLRSLFGRDRWAVAFALGLLHGFGFSSALAELGLSRDQLLPALLGFNLGVELGQLALVALFVPVAFLLRRSAGYRRLGLQAGSLVIASLAAVWLVERAFNLSLLG
jgi:HupE / UreJ protein